MKKSEVRREFFKLRIKGHSYAQSRKLIKAVMSYDVSIRTLKRWNKKFEDEQWNLEDKSKRPKTIHYKTTQEQEKEIISFRRKTGFGEWKIANLLWIKSYNH